MIWLAVTAVGAVSAVIFAWTAAQERRRRQRDTLAPPADWTDWTGAQRRRQDRRQQR